MTTNNDRESYPEHEKLAQVAKQSQAIGEFIVWMAEEKHWQVCEDGNAEAIGLHMSDWKPVRVEMNTMLAEFFEIDQKVLNDEKEAMVEAIRKHSSGF
jgi:hypothetical protein